MTSIAPFRPCSNRPMHGFIACMGSFMRDPLETAFMNDRPSPASTSPASPPKCEPLMKSIRIRRGSTTSTATDLRQAVRHAAMPSLSAAPWASHAGENHPRLTRPLKLLASIVLHPWRFFGTLWPFGWSRRVVIFLVIQSLDNAISFRAKRRWFGGGVALTTEQDPEKPNPTYIEAGNRAAAWLARHTGGVAQSMVLEAVANIPSTAHILGGAVIGRDAASGVVDLHSRVFGYQNLLVCDGAAMPANPGVNPSLTITAIAEHAMSHVPLAAAARA
jgi:choline dehydrogenase-like flavoprotein